ncbi:MAG: nucleotidyltransferase family protein [Actinobacteria bacterium]|nr:nucleotidyltransferase family protein [Actinomycetota bacterium]
MRALDAVSASGLPDAWIGAGAVRDIVWSERYGRFDSADVRDVDVAYFDPADLSPERDVAAQGALTGLADLPWEATNQAAVHTWYREYFGGPPVEPFSSVHDAVATWPETATCVAVRLASATSDLEVCAPHGLADLLRGIWRVNPVRVTPEISAARLARQRVHARWPGVTIVPPV